LHMSDGKSLERVRKWIKNYLNKNKLEEKYLKQ
jgi:hypothetical protein